MKKVSSFVPEIGGGGASGKVRKGGTKEPPAALKAGLLAGGDSIHHIFTTETSRKYHVTISSALFPSSAMA